MSFRTELQYMGNTIFIKERRVCIKPLCSRLEAIQKVKPLLQVNNAKVLLEWLTLLAYSVQNYKDC